MDKRSVGNAGKPVAAGAESPVPTLTARLFTESPFVVRGRIVTLLIGVAGPLALAALAEGRFARFLLQSSGDAIRVTLEETRRLTEGEVLALARYAWEARPEVFDRLVESLGAEDPTLLRTTTGVLLLLALSARARLRRPRGSTG